MLPTGRLLPPYIKPEAFAPVRVIKEDKQRSPHEPSTIHTETYPLLKLNIEENKPEELQKFIDEVHTLLGSYHTDNEPPPMKAKTNIIKIIQIAFLKLRDTFHPTGNKPSSIKAKIRKIEEIISMLDAKEDKPAYFRKVKQELKTTLSELQKPFQNQFNKLLDQFREWGRIHDVDTIEAEEGIDKLQKNFFEAGYSGSQNSPAYFENIKKNLEKIFLVLQNDTIPLTKRKEYYKNSTSIFHVCASGLPIHLQNIVFSLYTPLSLTAWLVGLRTEVIQAYANIHNVIKEVGEGSSVHTESFFARYAEDQGWSSSLDTKDINDAYLVNTNIEPDDLLKFHAYFKEEYIHNPTAIRACIQKNLYKAINEIVEVFGFKIDEWNIVNNDYTEFFKAIMHILKQLDLNTVKEYDLHELNDEDTQFKLHMNHLVDILCERVLMTSVLYYDSANNKYRELVPAFWLDPRHLPTPLDISVWNNIPNHYFPSVLFRVLNVLSMEYIDILLNRISITKIKSMQKNNFYKKHLSLIPDSEKRAYIDKKIFERGVPIEYRTLDTLSEKAEIDDFLNDIYYKLESLQKNECYKEHLSFIRNIENRAYIENTISDLVAHAELYSKFNRLSTAQIEAYLDNGSYEQLESMNKNKFYKKHLSLIQNSKKSTYIDKKVTDRLSQAEHQEKKRIHQNAFFQPGILIELINLGKKILQGKEKDIHTVLVKIRNNPHLLDFEVTVPNPLGTPVKGTLLQLAAIRDLKANITNEKNLRLVERIITAGNIPEEKVALKLQ